MRATPASGRKRAPEKQASHCLAKIQKNRIKTNTYIDLTLLRSFPDVPLTTGRIPMNATVTPPFRSAMRLTGIAGVAALFALTAPFAGAQDKPAGREVPARVLPVPTTVSPQMQKIIGAPIPATWKVWPQTPEEWKAQVAKTAAAV